MNFYSYELNQMINIEDENKKLQVKVFTLFQNQNKLREFLGEAPISQEFFIDPSIPSIPSIKELLFYIHPDKIHLHPFSEKDKEKISDQIGHIIGENMNVIQGLQILEKEISPEAFQYLCQKLSITWNKNITYSSLDIYYELRKMVELSDQNINMIIEIKITKIYLDIKNVILNKQHFPETKLKDIENCQEIPIFAQIKEKFSYLEDYFMEKTFNFFTCLNLDEIKKHCISEIKQRMTFLL
jgi:hypothetical protein